VNKKLELDMSEFLIAAECDNTSRMAKILGRLSFDQKERMARGLLKALIPTLFTLPSGTAESITKEFGFEIDKKEKVNV
jgi:hypothetical protein